MDLDQHADRAAQDLRHRVENRIDLPAARASLDAAAGHRRAAARRTRSTQTNEVGRCAALLPALTQLAVDAPGAPHGGGRPLGLVEVGASAGLNLLVDRYGYEYEPGHHLSLIHI